MFAVLLGEEFLGESGIDIHGKVTSHHQARRTMHQK
jgi:hypothetical protein